VIFEKIDEHLDKIDLNIQLGESKEKLKDTLEENIKLQKEIDYQKNVNVIKENLRMRKTRADKAIYKIEHIYDPFIEKNTALKVELKIKEYIRDLVRAPPFFRDFVIKQQVKHLDMVLSRPDKWSPEMIQLVENGIK